MNPESKWLREFAGFLPCGILFANPVGDVLFVNEPAASMLGVDILDLQLHGLSALPPEFKLLYQEPVVGAATESLVKDTWDIRVGKSSYAVNSIRGGIALFGERCQLFIITEISAIKNQVELGAGVFTELVPRLRGPLTSINTALSILASDKYIDMPESAREIVSMGSAESQRMNSLLGSLSEVLLLEGSQAEGGLFYESFDLGKVLDQIIRDATRSVPGPGRNIILSVEPLSGPFQITADIEKLRLSLSNVLSNALVYSPTDTPVTLWLGSAATRGQAELVIEDRGQGIHDEDLPFIYKKFHQAKHSASHGEGLGLYLAKSYLEMMGGSLRLETRWQKGTKAIIQLPLGSKDPWKG